MCVFHCVCPALWHIGAERPRKQKLVCLLACQEPRRRLRLVQLDIIMGRV